LHQKPITAANFKVEQMNSAMSDNIYWKECTSGSDSSIKDLSKFNPNEFETCQDAFVNFLAGKYGVTGDLLYYVICDVMVPDHLELDEILRCHWKELPMRWIR
jgi:hypothetical protein